MSWGAFGVGGVGETTYLQQLAHSPLVLGWVWPLTVAWWWHDDSDARCTPRSHDPISRSLVRCGSHAFLLTFFSLPYFAGRVSWLVARKPEVDTDRRPKPFLYGRGAPPTQEESGNITSVLPFRTFVFVLPFPYFNVFHFPEGLVTRLKNNFIWFRNK